MRHSTATMVKYIMTLTQEEYMKRSQRELKKKHALELKQQPKSLKQKEILIRNLELLHQVDYEGCLVSL